MCVSSAYIVRALRHASGAERPIGESTKAVSSTRRGRNKAQTMQETHDHEGSCREGAGPRAAAAAAVEEVEAVEVEAAARRWKSATAAGKAGCSTRRQLMVVAQPLSYSGARVEVKPVRCRGTRELAAA